MRTYSLTCLLLFLLFNSSLAQDKIYRSDSILINTLGKTQLELNFSSSLADSTIRLSFSKVICFDARLDTSCIGIKTGLNKRMDLFPSVPSAFTTFLNGALKSNLSEGNEHLLIFIKRLKLCAYDSISRVAKLEDISFKTNAEIECYYKIGDALYPAFRIDTTIYTAIDDIEHTSELLKPITEALITKSLRINREKVIKRNSYNLYQVTQNYENRKSTSFGSAIPAKGLYESLEAFKLNTPTYPNAKMTYKKSSAVFHTEADSIIPYGKYAFYSDGSRLWINTPFGFAPLIRNGNRYEFYGYGKYYNKINPVIYLPDTSGPPAEAIANTAASILLNSRKVETIPKRIHYLDLETGMIF